MICPNCREDNAPTFRFCGMCGTPLEPRRQPGAPALDPMSAFPASAAQRVAGADPTVRLAGAPSVTPSNETRPANRAVPPISGPSMLGLNQPSVNQSTPSPSRPVFESDPLSSQYPSKDLLRERAFSGLDSFLEPEEPKTGGRRIFLLIVLLAALGGAGWWTYTNYLGLGEKHPAASVSTDSTPPDKTPTKPASTESPAASTSPAATPAPASVAPVGVRENAGESFDKNPKPAPAETKPAETARKNPAPIVSKPEKKPVLIAKAAKPPEPLVADTSDAAFRKGEAYLYGRGVPENCDEAVKNLKAASAKSNAKARSAFGTMYATGHCVPRDLPTSYMWFALALRIDPNNQILEKDLSAVWNQMTPPERQMATRMKQ